MHHGHVHVLRRLAAPAVVTAVGVVALGFCLVGFAQAVSCAHVSISPGVQSPTLSPKTATITAGGCAAYANNTAFPVKVTVGKASDVANPNGVVTFVVRTPGKFTVSAQEQLQGQGIGGTGTGTLVVKAAPAPKPTTSPGTTSPTPHSSSPPPTATPTSSGPARSPTPPPPSSPAVTPTPNQSGQGNPPVIVGQPPLPSPSASSTALSPIAQIQPPSGRAAGLPAAIAALLVVGGGAAFVRVLLAEPFHAVPRPS